MESITLLPDLQLIVIDYLGENKHQLNYKKVLKEYESNYRWDDYRDCLIYDNYLTPNSYRDRVMRFWVHHLI